MINLRDAQIAIKASKKFMRSSKKGRELGFTIKRQAIEGPKHHHFVSSPRYGAKEAAKEIVGTSV
jgi:hypothetical protein